MTGRLKTLCSAGLLAAVLPAGCAGLPAGTTPEPSQPSADPAVAKAPQFQINLELGKKRELLKMDLRFLRGRIDAVQEEIAVLERDLKITPGSPIPGPPKPIPAQPPLPTLPASAPAPAVDPAPADPANPVAEKPDPMDPTERRLRREIEMLAARRDADLTRWHDLLRRRGELRDELHRRSAPAAGPIPLRP